MRRSVPRLARRASTLLQSTDAGPCSCSAGNPASALRPYAAAAAQPGAPPNKAAASATPAPGSPTAAAQAAMGKSQPGTTPGGGAGASPGGVPPAGPESSGSGGGGGGGWFLPVLTLAAAGGGYYVYSQQQGGQGGLPQLSREQMDSTQKAAVDMFNKGKARVQELLPAALGGTGKSSSSSSSSSSDKLHKQKQLDQDHAGFKLLPPGSEDASATAAAADAAAAASAAARDSMSAAADEFPGSTAGAADQQGVHTQPGVSGKASPAAAPASEDAAAKLAASMASMQGAAGAGAQGAAAGSSKAPQAEPTAGAAPAPAFAQAPAAAREPALPLHEVEDSELERLCQKLGVAKDLAPSGLVAAANRAGLGPVSSSGAHLPPQMAQLNQATADARILGEVMELAAQNTAKLAQQLEEARRHAAWTEEAAQKRESSLTDHFKELMREQSRIHTQLTEAAVREAQQVVAADTAKAHLQERQERLQQIDALRDKVNALALAFEQRTAQLRSVQDVNKVSVGMLSLSKALEEGSPVAPHLQQLAASCPDDPLVEAVAASLPASAVAQGLPTLQELRERFQDVALAAAEAAYFSGQEAQGGVLAHLAAKLAAKLKVDAGSEVDNGVDSKLSQARALLQQGRLLAAADALAAAADGTQAAAVVQQWVADARARAAADQAVKLLQAHATATAGLSS